MRVFFYYRETASAKDKGASQRHVYSDIEEKYVHSTDSKILYRN